MTQSLPHCARASYHVNQQKGENKEALADNSPGWFGLGECVDLDFFGLACCNFLGITGVTTGNGLFAS